MNFSHFYGQVFCGSYKSVLHLIIANVCDLPPCLEKSDFLQGLTDGTGFGRVVCSQWSKKIVFPKEPTSNFFQQMLQSVLDKTYNKKMRLATMVKLFKKMWALQCLNHFPLQLFNLFGFKNALLREIRFCVTFQHFRWTASTAWVNS